MDIEKLKQDLREEFIAVSNLEYNENLENANEVIPKWLIKNFESEIFTAREPFILNEIDIIIDFIPLKDSKKLELWNYLRNKTSSIPQQKHMGRSLSFFIRDRKTTKILGISRIGSDIFQYEARDKFIGWDYEMVRIKLPHIVNIWCCISMQPLGFNYNIGKLIASLCFSKEVLDEWEKRYKEKIAIITTFSIHGKSIQYDRLPCLQFVGFTKGNGTKVSCTSWNLVFRIKGYCCTCERI
jgi:hypothetical protein